MFVSIAGSVKCNHGLFRKKKFGRSSSKKVVTAEISGIGAREKEGVPVTGEADTERQLPENPQEDANGQSLARGFLNLIKKWDVNVRAARTAVSVVTGRESAKLVSSVEVHIWKKFPVFNLKMVDVETAASLPTKNKAMVGMMREMNLTTMQAVYATLLMQFKLASALVYSGSSVSLVRWNFLQSLGFSDALDVYRKKFPQRTVHQCL